MESETAPTKTSPAKGVIVEDSEGLPIVEDAEGLSTEKKGRDRGEGGRCSGGKLRQA